MPHVILSTCTKCGMCIPECPTGSISEGTDHFYIDADTCADHKACVAVCPADSIVLRKEPPPDKKLQEEEEES